MRLSTLILYIVTTMTGSLALAQQNPEQAANATQVNSENKTNRVSPVRNIERDARPQPETPVFEVRAIDGRNNNIENSAMGATHTVLQRYTRSGYSDGISSLAGENRPSPRLISNLVFAQDHVVPNSHSVTDFMWQWGQFLDHDIDLTDGIDPEEPANILVPAGDRFFDPLSTGIAEIPLNRSVYDLESGTDQENPRQQINEITAWIDASNVYGSSAQRAEALRLSDGSGQLKTSEGRLLPFNESGLANAGGTANTLFLAGDVRANEQVGLTTMHTLFVREHNRQARRIRRDQPDLSGEEIYQAARDIITAQMQVITYREFLPLLLGRNGIPAYRGYDATLNADIANEFSTAAYRLGHSLLSPQILRLDENGEEIAAGHLSLREAFFRPDEIINEGLEPILRGLASQVCQTIDNYVIDDVRNFLFGPPGAGGFDLVSLNIQRGRDHGLASYNQARQDMGLVPVSDFSEISSDVLVQTALAAAYETVDDIDMWVGGLAEDHYEDAMVGELFFYILQRQFVALRDGDRFWYQNSLSEDQIKRVEDTRLSDIIRRNTAIGSELQRNVFLAADAQRNGRNNGDRRDNNERSESGDGRP
ncbi:peroxidase family protein [Planctobacterium marinum]|uniref:peroxidase family protein n=1 Tax=Planctobacterium marinum TaxID=1631968 RepID=UPI001E5F34C5|nr:peroxidase family protein [Planctobacterium marinum]MCC2606380.1 hypothetical protein [Planctobacterium marinum]